MDSLEERVNLKLGQKLKLSPQQGQSHHLFDCYINNQTKERYYLKTIQLNSNHYISQAVIQLKIRQYGSLLLPMNFVSFQRQLRQQTFLIKSEQNIIQLHKYLKIKQQCTENVQKDFIVKLLQFLMILDDRIAKENLPLPSSEQIGVNQHNQFLICDPIVYFASFELVEHKKLKFSRWIQSFFKSIIRINHQGDDQINKKIDETFGQLELDIKIILHDIILGKMTKEKLLNSLLEIKNRVSEQVTTIASSFADINDIYSHHSTLLAKKKPKFKFGIFVKIIFVLVLIIFVAVCLFFSINFFSKPIICSEGLFLNYKNQCMPCSTGCLKCKSADFNKCMKCISSMFLVLEEEEDKEGFCLKECSGKKIHINDCVRNKNIFLKQLTS